MVKKLNKNKSKLKTAAFVKGRKGVGSAFKHKKIVRNVYLDKKKSTDNRKMAGSSKYQIPKTKSNPKCKKRAEHGNEEPEPEKNIDPYACFTATSDDPNQSCEPETCPESLTTWKLEVPDKMKKDLDFDQLKIVEIADKHCDKTKRCKMVEIIKTLPLSYEIDVSRAHLIIALIFLNYFGGMCVGIQFVLCSYEFGNFKLFNKGDIYCRSEHHLFGDLGFMLLGNGVIMFRILAALQFRQAKLVHALYNLTAFCLFSLGIYCYRRHKAIFSPSLDWGPAMFSVHSKIGILFYVMTLTQLISGVMVYLRPDVIQQSRQKFYKVHGIIGTATFYIGIAVVCTGHQFEEVFFRRHMIKYTSGTPDYVTLLLPATFAVLFSVPQFFIAMNSFFEWEKIYNQW